VQDDTMFATMAATVVTVFTPSSSCFG